MQVSVREVIWYLMHKANSGEGHWKMTKDTGAKNQSALRSASAAGKDLKARGIPPASKGSSTQQPPSDGPLGTSHSRGGPKVTSAQQQSSDGPPGKTYSKDVQVLTADETQKLQPQLLHPKMNKSKPVIWEMSPNEKDKPQHIRYQDVKLCLDTNRKPIFVFYHKGKAAYRLRVHSNASKTMEGCTSNGQLQMAMSGLKL